MPIVRLSAIVLLVVAGTFLALRWYLQPAAEPAPAPSFGSVWAAPPVVPEPEPAEKPAPVRTARRRVQADRSSRAPEAPPVREAAPIERTSFRPRDRGSVGVSIEVGAEDSLFPPEPDEWIEEEVEAGEPCPLEPVELPPGLELGEDAVEGA